MIIDQKILKIFLKNLDFSEEQQELFINKYASDISELSITYIISHMSSSFDDSKRKELEKLAEDAGEKNSVEAQRKLMEWVKEYIQTNPNIGPDLNNYILEFDKKFFFQLMEQSDAKGQNEALEYLDSLVNEKE